MDPDEMVGPTLHPVDLASRWTGSSVLDASDEAFGDKEDLLKPSAAAFEPGRYGNRGEIVDGWETRRRREPGHDWALIRLGTPGIITSVDVDTSFFTGNFPESCSLDACGVEGYPSPKELRASGIEWVSIVPRSPLRGDAHNAFPVSGRRRFTHVRLSIYPDGGVARLRVYGDVIPDPRLVDDVSVDLASDELGGAIVATSDDFYTPARSLIRQDRARTMGEGWETRRRRDEGPDVVVLQLGLAGRVRRIEIDTAHFKYNASKSVAVHCSAVQPPPAVASTAWSPLLRRTNLQPDTRHVFPIHQNGLVGSVRIDAYPDGGLSRVRVLGDVDPAARRRAGLRWFNALPAAQGVTCLVGEGISPADAARIVDQRPLPLEWRDRLGAGATGARVKSKGAYLEALARILDGAADRRATEQ